MRTLIHSTPSTWCWVGIAVAAACLQGLRGSGRALATADSCTYALLAAILTLAGASPSLSLQRALMSRASLSPTTGLWRLGVLRRCAPRRGRHAHGAHISRTLKVSRTVGLATNELDDIFADWHARGLISLLWQRAGLCLRGRCRCCGLRREPWNDVWRKAAHFRNVSPPSGIRMPATRDRELRWLLAQLLDGTQVDRPHAHNGRRCSAHPSMHHALGRPRGCSRLTLVRGCYMHHLFSLSKPHWIVVIVYI